MKVEVPLYIYINISENYNKNLNLVELNQILICICVQDLTHCLYLCAGFETLLRAAQLQGFWKLNSNPRLAVAIYAIGRPTGSGLTVN